MIVRRRITLDDRARSPWLELPFELRSPDGVEIELTVHGEARIDLGCRGPAGWRGWSGGARRRVVLAPHAATWGYLPGPTEPGEWHVVLGLHEVPLAGVEAEVRITTPPGAVEADPPGPPPRSDTRTRPPFPAPAGTTWLASDLHAHTLHSDGALSIDQLAALAVSEGLDVLAVTDHNTVSHHALLPAVSSRRNIVLLPGQEVTTGRGHANAWGDIGWIDFREHPDEWFRTVRRRGGVISINHPVSGDCAWQWSLSEPLTHAELLHASNLGRPQSAENVGVVDGGAPPHSGGRRRLPPPRC